MAIGPSVVRLKNGNCTSSWSIEFRRETDALESDARKCADMPTIAKRRQFLDTIEERHGANERQLVQNRLSEIWENEKLAA